MNYEEYFDSLIDRDLYAEKEEIFRILIDKHENKSVRSYDGLNEMVFEFILALNEQEDFDSIIKLKETLEKYYIEILEVEYGQFADILIPYYISINQDNEAKRLFNVWIEKDYDYDMILILINRLAHYGKESWIDEYITKEYNTIKTSPKLISGAEEDLIIYKTMIEFGKFNSGIIKMNGVLEELAKYELKITDKHKEILEEKEEKMTFRKDRRNYVFKILNEFQKYVNLKYAIPYVESGIVMNTLTNYFEDGKYNDLVTYFKIQENSFEKFMDENSVNGLNFNIESNYAMLYFLPVFYQFLAEKKIFKDEDVKNENEIIISLLKKCQQKYKRGSWVLDKLKSYNSITAANRVGNGE